MRVGFVEIEFTAYTNTKERFINNKNRKKKREVRSLTIRQRISLVKHKCYYIYNILCVYNAPIQANIRQQP